MAMLAAVSDTSIARSHRVIGLVNLALAITCLAAPAVRSSVGGSMAVLMAMCLLTGAALMSFVARCFDPRPRGAFAMMSNSIWQIRLPALATA